MNPASRASNFVLARLLLSIACAALVPGAARADGIVSGQWVPGAPDTSASAPADTRSPARTANAVIINFDELSAPCIFNNTTALRDAYLALGVRFSGQGSLGGGSVLDQCGNFGVSGYSPPNFVGFNRLPAATTLDGGHPVWPERITFTAHAASVQARVGSSSPGGVFTMRAFDSIGNLIATTSVPGMTALQPLTITHLGIRSVEVDFTIGYSWVLDDLTFEADQLTRADASSWGRLKIQYR